MKTSVERRKTKAGKYIVVIGFRSVDKEDNSWTNYFASWITSSNTTRHIYTHVELRFSDGYVTSITNDPGVVHLLEGKLMSNRKYSRFFEIHLSFAQEQKMRAYAERAKEENIGFNACGMYWNFIPCACFTISGGGRKVFCSQYITELFQEIGLLTDLIPEKTSPTALFEAMSNDGAFKNSYNEAFVKKLQSIKRAAPQIKRVLPKRSGLKKKR